jgi:hypothetical protein
MLQNLEATGRIPPRLTPIERLRQVMAPHPLEPLADEETLDRGVFDRPEPAPQAPAGPAFFPAPPEEPAASAPVEEPAVFAPAEEEPVGPAPSSPPRLRPGAGLLARRIVPPEEPEPAPSVEPVFAPPEEPLPRFRSPWDEPARPAEEEPIPEPEPLPEPFVPETEPAPVFDVPVTPEPEPAIPVAAAATPEVPELVKELLGTSSDEGGEESARDLVVDLGDYEGRAGRRPAEPEQEPPPAAPKQPVLTGASAEPTERSGLLGAVRSAFARNKVQHEHEFVEAPGGIGIVRQICAECGYISIGVSD